PVTPVPRQVHPLCRPACRKPEPLCLRRQRIEHAAGWAAAPARLVLLLLHDFPDPGRSHRVPCSSPPSDTQTGEISPKPDTARTRGLPVSTGRPLAVSPSGEAAMSSQPIAPVDAHPVAGPGTHGARENTKRGGVTDDGGSTARRPVIAEHPRGSETALCPARGPS